MVQPTPEVVGGAIVALGAAGSAAYAVYKGRGASVDVDDDGTDEVTIEPAPEPCESMADQTMQNGDENDDGGEDDEPSFEADDLTDVTGVAEARAEKLNDAGIDTVLDLYEADDETITSIDGMGDHALGQIRDDIGSDEDGPREMDDDLEEAITEADGDGGNDEDGSDSQSESDSDTDASSPSDDSEGNEE